MSISRDWSQQKHNYYIDFITVPIIAAIALYVGGFSFWMIAGFIAWTISEYLIHRFLFHIRFRNEHWLHHIHEKDYVGISSFKTTGLVLLFAITAYLISCLPFFAGYVIGYFLYMVIHDTIHHENTLTKYIPNLVFNHEVHHRIGTEVNFGVITPFWDKFFGTYQPYDNT